MDTGRLPAYRSSYLLRFHPYPRVKPSTRERIVSTGGNGTHELLEMNFLHSENNIPVALDQAIHGTIQLDQRRLSMSSLVVDLALLFAKMSSS